MTSPLAHRGTPGPAWWLGPTTSPHASLRRPTPAGRHRWVLQCPAEPGRGPAASLPRTQPHTKIPEPPDTQDLPPTGIPPSWIPHLAAWVLPHPVMQGTASPTPRAALSPRSHHRGTAPVGSAVPCRTWPRPSGQPPQDSPTSKDSRPSRHPRPQAHRHSPQLDPKPRSVGAPAPSDAGHCITHRSQPEVSQRIRLFPSPLRVSASPCESPPPPSSAHAVRKHK